MGITVKHCLFGGVQKLGRDARHDDQQKVSEDKYIPVNVAEVLHIRDRKGYGSKQRDVTLYTNDNT